MKNWNNSNRWEYCQKKKENPRAGKENPAMCNFKNMSSQFVEEHLKKH